MSARQSVLGMGGVFFKARDHKALAAWYRQHLGIPVADGQTFAEFPAGPHAGPTVWSTFAASTDYFSPGTAPFMFNYRVADLDAMLAQLRSEGVLVDERVESTDYGKFGWASDPEGNRFELWQPPE